MKLTEKQNEAIIDFFYKSGLAIDGTDALNIIANKISPFTQTEINWENFLDEIKNDFEECFNEDSFIYYQHAIEYLAENDPSLQQSLEIAFNFGYDLKNLDSVKLADLHCYNAQMEELNNFDFQDLISIIKNN